MTPRLRLLVLASLTLPVLAAAVWLPALQQLGLLCNLVLIAFCIADVLLTESLKKLRIERDVSEVLSVGTNNPVSLVVRNAGRRTASLTLFDEPPQPGTTTDNPVQIDVNDGQERSQTYRFEPHERGRKAFNSVYLRKPSFFGLWNFIERRMIETPVRVLPDIRAVYQYELMARRNRLDELGIKIQRLRGQGREFERLREYRREDDPRQIDWKATARHQELVSREFNVERNQNIVVALDCGRSMRNESEGISYLDRALNASIMLSYIALGQADNVGLMAFSNRIEKVVRPVRGKPAIQTVLQNSFDLEARREASDYTLAMEQINRRFRKRSLVVLLTHVIDDIHLEELSHSLRSFRSRHLFLCVFLRDRGLTTLATRQPESDLEAFQCAAAAELLTAVDKKTSALHEQGILTLSSLPDELSAAAINGYLDVKARHLI